MSGPKFFQTMMGRKFFEGHVPRVIQALENVAEGLRAVASALVSEETITAEEKQRRDALQSLSPAVSLARMNDRVRVALLLASINKYGFLNLARIREDSGLSNKDIFDIFHGAEVTLQLAKKPEEDPIPYDVVPRTKGCQHDGETSIGIAVFENKHDTEVFPVEEGATREDVIEFLREQGKWNEHDDEEDSNSYVRIEGPFSIPEVALPFKAAAAGHIYHVARWEIAEYGKFGDGLPHCVSIECTECGEVIGHIYESEGGIA